LAAGGDDYLIKPIRFSVLKDRLDRAIQIARSGNPDRRRTEIHRRVSGRRD
jgi:DNA-binding response OmpR family regulator